MAQCLSVHPVQLNFEAVRQQWELICRNLPHHKVVFNVKSEHDTLQPGKLKQGLIWEEQFSSSSVIDPASICGEQTSSALLQVPSCLHELPSVTLSPFAFTLHT